MINKLRKLINQYSVEKEIEPQQALRELISNIKSICFSMGLDFESALDKSDPYVEFLNNGCNHRAAYPCNNDNVFCPHCEQYIVEGKTKVDKDWIKQNHWRTPVVPLYNEENSGKIE
jgi:hypothetical protein